MSEKRARIYVTIAGERLEIIPPGYGYTFEEAKLAKTVSEGMSPVEIEQGLLMADPDAWLAVLRVSYLRADKDFPAEKIAGEDILELSNAVAKALREANKGLPPTSASGNGQSEPGEKPENDPATDQS